MFAVIADINECLEGTAECDADASCNNTIGGYNCSCNSGYEGDGFEGNCSSECKFFSVFNISYLHNCISLQILMNVPEIHQSVIPRPIVQTQMVATCAPVILASLDQDSFVLVSNISSDTHVHSCLTQCVLSTAEV